QEGLTGTLALTIAVLFERAHASRSPWSSYLASLPRHAPTPLFWESEQDLALLTPTDVPVTEYKESLISDFETIVQPFIERNASLFSKEAGEKVDWRQEFFAATSLVTSRAFLVDAFHGDALVPLADLFNHLSGGEHVHMEGDGDVCVFCGAVEDGCDCMWSDDEEEDGHEEDEEMDEEVAPTLEEVKSFSVKQLKTMLLERGGDASGCVDKQDLVDKVMESFSKKAGGADDDDGWEDDDKEESSWLLDLEEPIPDLIDEKAGKGKSKSSAASKKQAKKPAQKQDDDDDEPEQEDSLDITVYRPVKPNSQIFNIYGDHTNAKLLNLYGFSEISNPNNTVLVSPTKLIEILGSGVSSSVMNERLAFWNQFGRKIITSAVSGEDDDEDDEHDDHVHGEGCNHDHDDHDSHSITTTDGNEMDKHSFFFDNDGEASPHLLAFLHIMLMEPKALLAFTKDEASFRKYAEHVVKNGLDTWQASAASTNGSGKKGKSAPKKPVNATEGPVVLQMQTILHGMASNRLAAYDGCDAAAEEAEMKDIIANKVFSPRRWALFVRTEERRILNSALKRYKNNQ
ncbi:hypothetical protein HDU78_011595, partial [Chytriomyces hyalinus]